MVPAAKRAARWKERNAVIASPAAPLIRGRLTVRAAETPGDLARIMDLRSQVFRAGAEDGDVFAAQAVQVLVECGVAILAAFRLIPMDSGAGLATGYAAQSYDLSRLAAFPLPVLELGRFCTAPEAAGDPDILRAAWAFLAREVDARGAGMLCGCTSFPGADPARHAAALAHLARHVAPERLAPLPRCADPLWLADLPPADPALALAGLPPLLRTYLMMGGWVSDHAVRDADLDTLHVFTAVDIAAIPPARARALRALAEDPKPR